MVASGVFLLLASGAYGQTDAWTSTVTSSGSPALADGADSVTIIVTLLDGAAVPVPAHMVSLDPLASVNPAAVAIVPPVGLSDGAGHVTFTATCTVDQFVFFQATDMTDLVVIDQAPGVRFYLPDVEAVYLSYDSVTVSAELSYSVDSPVAVGAYTIEFFLDDNPQNGNLDPGDSSLGTVAGATAPGSHTATRSYSGNPPATGQAIFAVVDSTGAIGEADETNNEAMATSTAVTDLIAVSLAYDSVTETAQLGYTVSSPVAVAPYSIEFFLDDNPQNGSLSPGDSSLGTVAGATAPGSHTATRGYGGNPPATGQAIFAVVDSTGAIG
ncbi:MAG: hypothetical protein JXQ75_02190, partial [Phycisphaerae bacterium]|nr:hypothetical protein [Phycisphaerae bacterium]